MAETKRPDSCHATRQCSLISLEQILTDFWLRIELKLRQRTQTMLATSCTPRCPPPDLQQRPTALLQPRKAGRRTKLPSYRHRMAKLKMPPKPRACTPRTPSILRTAISRLKDPPQQLPSRPEIYRIETPPHGNPWRAAAQPQRGIG
ncbi:Hypothetical predicted protein [Pelobates cultripes]|uniref:Uncharacterized protein n=1 Tax=Pelobates cultripes TaxID=61616 RepID=A0AAD1RE76_PELCU|nr:Hypothetical predicted protein [Pelobates cultripes]